jgi:hypothetical protein
MAKYLLLYKGPATPMEQITPEVGEQLMKAWNDWIAGVGDAMVDVGEPLSGGHTAVHGDGSTSGGSDLNGYSIIEATDLEAASAFTKDHPFLADSGAEFSVEVHEITPIMM